MANNHFRGTGTQQPSQTTNPVPVAESHPADAYPKWKYHSKEPAVVVHTPEDEEKLQGQWHDVPQAGE